VGGAREWPWQERRLAMLVSQAADYAIFVMDTDGVILT
jgi:hypothetical protein